MNIKFSFTPLRHVIARAYNEALYEIQSWNFVSSTSQGLNTLSDHKLNTTPRKIAQILLTIIIASTAALIVSLVTGIILTASASSANKEVAITSPAYEACINNQSAYVWMPKVDVAGVDFTYPEYHEGPMRIESANLARSVWTDRNLSYLKMWNIAQADAWDPEHDLTGEFEAYVSASYWTEFWIQAFNTYTSDQALMYHDVLCVTIPSKSDMIAAGAVVEKFNGMTDFVAKYPAFNQDDFNPSAIVSQAKEKVVEINCKNLKPVTTTKTEAECIAQFKTSVLSGVELTKAISLFYAGILMNPTPTFFAPPVEMTTYPEGLNSTQVVEYGQLYATVATGCNNDPDCIGKKWDEVGYTFSDAVISQVNNRCGDLTYCRGLVILYAGQGYSIDDAIAEAMRHITEVNTMAQTKSCSWDQISTNSCIAGASLIYIINVGGGVDMGIAFDSNGGIIDTIDSVTGAPYDTSRSKIVPIPPGTAMSGDYIDYYGNMKGGLLVSTQPFFSGNSYILKTSSINGYSCFDEQPFYQTQVGSVWAYPSKIDPMTFCSPVIQPQAQNTPMPSNPNPTLPPLEQALVNQGADVSSGLVLSFVCTGVTDGNYYFSGSGYNLSIARNYFPDPLCSVSDKQIGNTIYITTQAGQSSVSVATTWTQLSGEPNLYWAKRFN